MLVLARSENERVTFDLSELLAAAARGEAVDPHIELTVVSVLNHKAKLGFEADQTIRIMRSELLENQTESRTLSGISSSGCARR